MRFVEFLDAGVAWDLTPEAALEFFKAKGLKPSFAWQDMIAEEHDNAFTIAKMMDVDMLHDVQSAMTKAIAEGQTFKEFSDSIVPMLQDKGWWGRKSVVDPKTGKVTKALLGSPHRLKTIFRTNMQSAYAVGHWDAIERQKAEAPYLLYDAVDDHRTRESHARWDGTVLPADDPWFDTHYPPNGWNCRCGVIQLDQNELDAYNLKPTKRPKTDTYSWTNPRTGKTRKVPEGLDPGWDYNPGKARVKKLAESLAEKAGPDAGSVMEAVAKAKQAVGTEKAAMEALKELGQASTTGAFARQKAKAIQAAAAHQLDQIATANTKYKASALKQIDKTKAGKAMTPSEKLAAVNDKAQKAEASAALANYKQAMLKEGKPSPKAQAAFDALPDEAKVAITQQIEDSTGVKAAKESLVSIMANPKGQTLKHKALKKYLDSGGTVTGANAKKVLADIEAQAAAQQAKASKASALSGYKKKVLAGKIPTPAQKKVFDTLTPDEQAAFLAKIEKGKTAPVTEIAEPPAATAVTAPATSAKATPVKPATPGKAADWTDRELTQIGGQGGSNEGGLFQDVESGEKFYIKYPASEDIARNEVLAGKLYELTGADTPELTLIKRDGRIGIASRIIDGLEKDAAALKAGKVKGAADSFVADAWLGNWDVVGLDYDNLMVKNGKAYRIDTGGALRYRAQGGQKGAAWGKTVTELDSMRQPGTNQQAASVFGTITQAELDASARRVLAVTDDDIRRAVELHGPADKATRTELANTLIARRKDIEKRFPHLAIKPKPAPKPAAGLIDKAEAAAVKNSRINGYTRLTDKGDIEDHNVRITESLDPKGKPVTTLTLKLRSHKVDEISKSAGEIVEVTELDLMPAWKRFETAAKGIGAQAGKGEAFRAVDIERLAAAADETNTAISKLQAGIKAGKYAPDIAGEALKQLRKVKREITWMSKQAVEGRPAQSWRKFIDLTKHMDSIAEIEKAVEDSASGVKWTQMASAKYKKKVIRDSNATDTAKQISFRNGKHLDATIGGVKVQIFNPVASDTLYNRGYTQITVSGHGEAAIAKGLEAMEKAGIDISRPTQTMRDELLLDQIANARYKDFSPDLYREFTSMNDAVQDQAERYKTKLAMINKSAGFDITQTAAWSEREASQAWGHGRKVLLRPDLDTPEFRKFSKETLLYHSLGTLSKGGINFSSAWREYMKPIFDGGGMLTSLLDRTRRGLPVSGQAAGADYANGGASYVFTRLKKRGHIGDGWGDNDVGFYWKPARHMRRTDRVSYGNDNFGDVTESNLRFRQETIDKWQENSINRRTDETIFKDGLSLFDDLEKIVVYDEAERQVAIKELKAMGYNQWPDGRPVEDIVHAKNK